MTYCICIFLVWPAKGLCTRCALCAPEMRQHCTTCAFNPKESGCQKVRRKMRKQEIRRCGMHGGLCKNINARRVVSGAGRASRNFLLSAIGVDDVKLSETTSGLLVEARETYAPNHRRQSLTQRWVAPSPKVTQTIKQKSHFMHNTKKCVPTSATHEFFTPS